MAKGLGTSGHTVVAFTGPAVLWDFRAHGRPSPSPEMQVGAPLLIRTPRSFGLYDWLGWAAREERGSGRKNTGAVFSLRTGNASDVELPRGQGGTRRKLQCSKQHFGVPRP